MMATVEVRPRQLVEALRSYLVLRLKKLRKESRDLARNIRSRKKSLKDCWGVSEQEFAWRHQDAIQRYESERKSVKEEISKIVAGLEKLDELEEIVG